MTKRELEPALLSLIRRGVSVPKAAKTLGVHPSTARRWLRDREQSIGGKELAAFAEIGAGERARWWGGSVLIVADQQAREQLDDVGVTSWESWDQWAGVYEECRAAWREMCAGRQPGSERLYAAWERGADVDRVRKELLDERLQAVTAPSGPGVLVVPTGDVGVTLGLQVADFIEANLTFGPGDLLGEPAVVDAEKCWILAKCYELFPADHPSGGRRRFKRAVLSLAKGTAKTELAAWIVACELHASAPVRTVAWIGDREPVGGPLRDPVIPMVAFNEEQSDGLCYHALKMILERSRVVDDFDIQHQHILRSDGTGRAVSLSSSPSARDGNLTSFQFADETHHWDSPRHREMHRVMENNPLKRVASDGWALEVTTAYQPGAGSVAELAMERAKQISEGKTKSNRLFYFHRGATEEHDLDDEEGVRAAVIEASGPTAASWRDVDSIVAMRYETDDFSYWRRVWLNQIVQGSSQAFDVVRWNELEADENPVEPGDKIVLGFDGSWTRDSTVLVAAHSSGYLWLAGCWERPASAADDWSVPVEEVDATVSTLFEQYAVVRMHADPQYWGNELSRWSNLYGKVILSWNTSVRPRMSRALNSFATALAEGELSHDGSEVLVRHLGNARRREYREADKDGSPMWGISKEHKHTPNKIDGAVALVLAWQALLDARAAGELEETKPSVYESRGILTIG